MKTLVAFLILIFPVLASAWDSVAVMIRPEKALIQINEPGSNGRLQNFFNALGAEREFLLETEQFKIDCGRKVDAATCVIRILPEPNQKLAPKFVHATLPLTTETTDFAAEFLNSNGDHLILEIKASEIFIEGRKR